MAGGDRVGGGGGSSENSGFCQGLPCGTRGRIKLCMVLCHSCHIYRIWTSKEIEEGTF